MEKYEYEYCRYDYIVSYLRVSLTRKRKITNQTDCILQNQLNQSVNFGINWTIVAWDQGLK